MACDASDLSIIELPEEISKQLAELLSGPLKLTDIDLNSVILIDSDKKAYLLQVSGKENPEIALSIDQQGVTYHASASALCSYTYTVVKSGTRCYIKRTNTATGEIRYMIEKRIYELDGSITRYYAKKNGAVCCVNKQRIVSGIVVSDEQVFSEGTTVGPYLEPCS